MLKFGFSEIDLCLVGDDNKSTFDTQPSDIWLLKIMGLQ